jgi:hypothetical protein
VVPLQVISAVAAVGVAHAAGVTIVADSRRVHAVLFLLYLYEKLAPKNGGEPD